MTLEGGCYCGKLRYRAEGTPSFRAQCHCRECQYLSGGGPNYFMFMPADGFEYVAGSPKSFTRTDIENPVTREFCADCGTQILSRRTGLEQAILKIGTLDDPAAYGGPQMAIYTVDQQPFHVLTDGLPAFERLPKWG